MKDFRLFLAVWKSSGKEIFKKRLTILQHRAKILIILIKYQPTKFLIRLHEKKNFYIILSEPHIYYRHCSVMIYIKFQKFARLIKYLYNHVDVKRSEDRSSDHLYFAKYEGNKWKLISQETYKRPLC